MYYYDFISCFSHQKNSQWLEHWNRREAFRVQSAVLVNPVIINKFQSSSFPVSSHMSVWIRINGHSFIHSALINYFTLHSIQKHCVAWSRTSVISILVISMTAFIQLSVHDSLFTTNTQETFHRGIYYMHVMSVICFIFNYIIWKD